MTLYLLRSWHDHEGSWGDYGIYASIEAARAAGTAIMGKEYPPDKLTVNEVELDAPPAESKGWYYRRRSHEEGWTRCLFDT